MSLDVGAATRTVITLRARFCGAPPRPGELMAAETGPAVYRVESVTILRQAGEQPGTHRYRLTCTRLASAEVLPDAAIHPWRWGGRAPRQTALQAPAGPWVAVPASKPIARYSGRSEAHDAAGDFGPGIRRKAIRDHRGRFLRDPDVEVEDQAVNSRHVRRARRVDTIDVLCRAGTIGRREVEAAGDLRQYLERITLSVAGGGLTRVGIAPHLCQPIMAIHLQAAKKLREASAALGERLWQPLPLRSFRHLRPLPPTSTSTCSPCPSRDPVGRF